MQQRHLHEGGEAMSAPLPARHPSGSGGRRAALVATTPAFVGGLSAVVGGVPAVFERPATVVGGVGARLLRRVRLVLGEGLADGRVKIAFGRPLVAAFCGAVALVGPAVGLVRIIGHGPVTLDGVRQSGNRVCGAG